MIVNATKRLRGSFSEILSAVPDDDAALDDLAHSSFFDVVNLLDKTFYETQLDVYPPINSKHLNSAKEAASAAIASLQSIRGNVKNSSSK
ncbi:hypothetical protein [Paracoccus jeotgali]|uniref:hypothetical protein n=1 Tax=Paracoccus jeotgali TaxID=2065379 RepID=UPI0028AB87CB|nr:hypothetical protein [Paracoccus jeotgali]